MDDLAKTLYVPKFIGEHVSLALTRTSDDTSIGDTIEQLQYLLERQQSNLGFSRVLLDGIIKNKSIGLFMGAASDLFCKKYERSVGGGIGRDGLITKFKDTGFSQSQSGELFRVTIPEPGTEIIRKIIAKAQSYIRPEY